MTGIRYKEGYKYVLVTDYATRIEIHPAATIRTEYIKLSKNGALRIKHGYAWDGASGPAFDTRNFMRGSLVHDCLYQLMREKLLPQTEREAADKILRRIVLEDGMSAVRAWWVFQGVRLGGGPSADPANDNPVIEAP